MSEDLPALRALVGLFACVRSLVPVEVGVAREALSTHITLIGLLTCVDPFVDSEARAVPEGLPTLTTLIGLLPSVNSLMLIQN